jgi:hypothetical protein
VQQNVSLKMLKNSGAACTVGSVLGHVLGKPTLVKLFSV